MPFTDEDPFRVNDEGPTMKFSRIRRLTLLLVCLCLLLVYLYLPEGYVYLRHPRDEAGKIAVMTVQSKPATVTRQYACLLQAWHYTRVQASRMGLVGDFKVKEGRSVKKGDLLFEIEPLVTHDTPSRDAGWTSPNESPVKVVAPFDGIVDYLVESRSNLVEQGDVLMALGDTGLMWAFFNVPEAEYLVDMANWKQDKENLKVEFVLTNGEKLSESGKIGAIEAQPNNGTGTIPVRADFPNPKHTLRHKQVGTVVIHWVMKDAIAIPRRAAYENSSKRYVDVVGEDHVARRREIIVKTEIDDGFIIKEGIVAGEKIVVEGVKRIRDGDKVE